MFQLTMIAVAQPLTQLIDIDATSKNIAQRRVHRYTRALKTDPTTCSLDQYFDAEEGRCLDVTGGGRVLYINNTNSCGADVLQPHCTNTRYYYICKNSKTILAQCIQGQQFENRLQRCVNSDDLVSSTVQPNPATYESIQLPECKRPGSFLVPDDCALFYTCETNGDRMVQNIFGCPKDMAYNTKTKMCSFSCNCENINSDVAFCAPTIVNEQNVEESTNTESSIRITDSDKDNETVEDTTLANINDEPVSTVSYHDLTPTEFTEVTVHADVVTERASNNLRSSDSEISTAYSATNESTTFMSTVLNEDRTPETETPVETTLAETDAETLMVDLTTPNDREIQTTENSMIVTEETTEELIPKVTADAIDSKIALADLSTPSSREIETTENGMIVTEETTEELIPKVTTDTVDSKIALADLSTPSSGEIETTENGMIVTEETTKELIPKVTADAIDSKIASADLSTPSSREIQSSEIQKNESLEDSTSNNPILNDEYDTTESSDDANVEVESSTNDPILKNSPLKDFKLNKKPTTTATGKKPVNVTKKTEPSSEKIVNQTGVDKNFPKNISIETDGTDPESISSLNDSSTTKLSASTESTSSLETTINPTQESDEGTTDGIEQPVESSTAMIIKKPSTGLTTLNKNENNNILSTTGPSDGNAEPTLFKNVDTNNENAVTNKNVNADADNKSIEPDEPLMINTSKANNGQEPSADFNERNVSDMPTTLTVSNSESNTDTKDAGTTEINPESLNKHSLVSDKRNATSKENDITGKESVTARKTTQPTMRVSTDIILPIMSAILIVADTLEQFCVHIFSGMHG